MKRPLAYITAAWCGDPDTDMELAARYCRMAYEAGFSPICPILYLPLFINDAIPEEHKNGIDMRRDMLRRSHVLVVCGDEVDEDVKNDIAVAKRLNITATTLDGILTVNQQGRHDVTNLGLYPERGAGAGEYLKFPTTVEEVQALFSRIGIDGKQYEEYFITDYDSDILGLTDHLGEYESLDELNYLAHLLEEMTPAELEKLEAVMDAGEYTSSVKDLINLTQNLDCFDFYSDVNSEEELGRMYIQDFEAIQVPEHLIDYIDYEAYGRDIRINDGGHFAPGGYVADNRSNFVEHYTGLDDIPDEYRISKVHARDEKEETHSILAAIKQFKEAPPTPYKEKAGPFHEER